MHYPRRFNGYGRVKNEMGFGAQSATIGGTRCLISGARSHLFARG
jgi:hypothetical protein